MKWLQVAWFLPWERLRGWFWAREEGEGDVREEALTRWRTRPRSLRSWRGPAGCVQDTEVQPR